MTGGRGTGVFVLTLSFIFGNAVWAQSQLQHSNIFRMMSIPKGIPAQFLKQNLLNDDINVSNHQLHVKSANYELKSSKIVSKKNIETKEDYVLEFIPDSPEPGIQRGVEVLLNKENQGVMAATWTFEAGQIRSYSRCLGNKEEVHCVTATARMCESVEKVFSKTDLQEDRSEDIRKCENLLDESARIAHKLSLVFSPQVQRRRDEVIDQDMDMVEKKLHEVTGAKWWHLDKPDVKNQSSGVALNKIEVNSKRALEGLTGLKNLVQLASACKEFGAHRKFKNPNQRDGSGAGATTSGTR